MEFNYDEAFSRNLGLISKLQQEKLKTLRIGIAGMGGVGGDYLITLARMGFQNFIIADFDRFELANFNRQYGAMVSSVGQPKTLSMEKLVKEINPQIQVVRYDQGLDEKNIDTFVDQCDLVVDGIEFFAVEAHQLLIEKSVAKGLTVLAAVPLGFSAAVLSFSPQSMSFQDYFAFKPSMTLEEKVILFAIGFAPSGLQLRYTDPGAFKLRERKGPSNISACKLCSGLIGAQAFTALFHPEQLKSLPWSLQMDARLNCLKQPYLAWGNRGWLQKLKFSLAKKKLLK